MDVPQRYQVSYRVRFDEAAADGNLRPSGWLRYAQDLAWQHSEAAGFDRHWYADRGALWLVRNARLELHGDAAYGDSVTGSTQVVGWRRVWARRRSTFESSAGNRLAEAETDWVLTDTEGKPTRIPDEIAQHSAPVPTYRPDRIRLDPTPPHAHVVPASVRRSDIDPLGHLNNATYLDLAQEAAAEVRADRPGLARFQLEFVRPAVAGAELRIAAWSGDAGQVECRITDAAGTEHLRGLIG